MLPNKCFIKKAPLINFVKAYTLFAPNLSWHEGKINTFTLFAIFFSCRLILQKRSELRIRLECY